MSQCPSEIFKKQVGSVTSASWHCGEKLFVSPQKVTTSWTTVIQHRGSCSTREHIWDPYLVLSEGGHIGVSREAGWGQGRRRRNRQAGARLPRQTQEQWRVALRPSPCHSPERTRGAEAAILPKWLVHIEAKTSDRDRDAVQTMAAAAEQPLSPGKQQPTDKQIYTTTP